MIPWLKKIRVIAHRGSSTHHTENTKGALLAAIKEGVDMIEVDVRSSKEGHLIIFHDETLMRLSKSHAKVYKKTWSELKEIKLKKGERILDLQECLELTKKIPLNLELKVQGIEKEVIKEIRKSKRKNILISSSKLEVLKQCKKSDPTIPTAAVLNYSQVKALKFMNKAKELGVEAIHPINRRAKQSLIDQAKMLGLSIRPFTINKKRRMHSLLERGCDALFTDKPQVLKQVVKELDL